MNKLCSRYFIAIVILAGLISVLAACDQPGTVIPQTEQPITAADWYNKGAALMAADKYNEAVQAFDKSLALNSSNADALSAKGYCLYSLGRYDEAVQVYDKAIAINPDYAEYWYGKAGALVKLNKNQEALAAYDKAVEIYPSYYEAWYDKGLLLEKMGDKTGAQECFDTAESLEELNPPLLSE
jgi:tetratricopeptide (TPR) repeat protein